MKQYLNILLVLLMSLLINSKTFGQDTKQIVNITNLEKIKGSLYVGWYTEAPTFRINEKAIYRERILVNNQKDISVVFKNIVKGTYAIAVFLDENDNYKLDKNFFGIPKEKYGFSNNVVPSLRPATFDESSFELKQKEMIININLK